MAVKLLDAATATGASTGWYERMRPSEHTVQGVITGGPSAVTVDLESSMDDGTTWQTLASHDVTAAELSAGSFQFHVTDKVAKQIRANLITLTGGTSPTVTVRYTANYGQSS